MNELDEYLATFDLRKTKIIDEWKKGISKQNKKALKICYYCGFPANERDHVIPRSVIERLKSISITNESVIEGRVLIVPACHECNRILSDSYQNSLEERKRELKRRLRKRYKKLLSWTQKEIDELGPGLKQSIQAMNDYKKALFERLKW